MSRDLGWDMEKELCGARDRRLADFVLKETKAGRTGRPDWPERLRRKRAQLDREVNEEIHREFGGK